MVSVIGGIFMILGSIFTYRGEILVSVFMYLIADFMWVYLSILSGNIVGAIVIFIALLLGIGAYLKMHFGVMRKTLKLD